jgi:cytochrome b561
MKATGQPRRYSTVQITLHWVVAVMIVAQWFTSGAIERTHNPLLPPRQADLILHALHNYTGIAIAVAVLLRIALRLLARRADAPLRTTGRENVAAAFHWAIYLSLISQAATGFITSYFWGPAGQVHVMIRNVTLALVAVHVAAATFHAFRRDGVAGRMVPWIALR